MPELEFLRCSDEEYHADKTSISNTELKVFADDPALFNGQRHGRWPRDVTPAFEYGIVLHAILSGKELNSVAMVIPQEVLSKSGAKHGKAWDEFREAHIGKTLFKREEIESVQSCYDSIMTHPRVRQLIKDQLYSEQPIRWMCAESGVRRRCKKDVIGENFVLDFKSTTDVSAEGFARSIARLGYDRQAAFYCDGAQALLGSKEAPPFVFVAVRKSPPFSCMAYEIDADWVAKAREEVMADLRRYRECMESGVWKAPGSDLIHKLNRPRWLDSKAQWEVSE